MIGEKHVIEKNLKVRNSITVLMEISKSEGKFKGLWRGSVPTFWRVFPGASVYFGTINLLKNYLNINEKNYNILNNFSIGFLARSISSTLISPLTVGKIKFFFFLIFKSKN
jgi:hypothetical protein